MLKIKGVILGLVLNSLSFAGTMGPVCLHTNVTTPCAMRQWDFDIEALYLQTLYDAKTSYLSSDTTNFKDVHNAWGWGFRLAGSYHFSTGNNLTIDWMNYDKTTSRVDYNLSNTNRFDQVNVVLGQAINLSAFFTTHLYGGLQYAAIRNYQLQKDVSLPPTVNQQRNSEYNGIGPVVGFDAAYPFLPRLSLAVHSQASVLRGVNPFILSNGVTSGLVISNRSANATIIVPSISEKIGVQYTRQLVSGLLTADAGFQALNYFHALSVFTSSHLINGDFALYGPYFGIHWLADV